MNPSPLHIDVVRATQGREQPWRNGGGRTRQIARAPAEGPEPDWRLSVAQIEHDGPFSIYPGLQRDLVLLRGQGLHLHAGDGARLAVPPAHGHARFSGTVPVRAELVDGPVSVFNLMWRPQRVVARLWLRPLVGSGVLALHPHELWAMHVVAGTVGFADAAGTALGMDDTALVRSADGSRRLRYEGAGMAIVMCIAPSE